MAQLYGLYNYPSFTPNTVPKVSTGGSSPSSYNNNKLDLPSQRDYGKTLSTLYRESVSGTSKPSAEEVTSTIQSLQKQLPKGSTVSFDPNSFEFRILVQSPQGTKEIIGSKNLIASSQSGINNVVNYATAVARGQNHNAVDLAAISQGRTFSSNVDTPINKEQAMEVKAKGFSYNIVSPNQKSIQEQQAQFMEVSKVAAMAGSANYSYDLGLNPIAKAAKITKAGFDFAGEPQSTTPSFKQQYFEDYKSIKETTKGIGYRDGFIYKEPTNRFETQEESTQRRYAETPYGYLFEKYEQAYPNSGLEFKFLMAPISYAIGRGRGIIGIGELGYGFLTNPVKTVEEQIAGIPQFIEFAKADPAQALGILHAPMGFGKAGKLIPKPFRKELTKTGKFIGKEIEPATSFLSDLGSAASSKAGELTPKIIKNIRPTINEYIYGKDIKPFQKVKIYDLKPPVSNILETKTQLGDTRTSIGEILIQEVRKTAGTTISGVTEGKVLVLQFDKPISVKTVVAELTKKGSELNTQIRQYTGVAIKPLIMELKKSGQTEVESLSIPFKIKGVGLIERRTIVGNLLGFTRKVEPFIIRGKSSAITFPEQTIFPIKQTTAEAIKRETPRIKSNVEKEKGFIEYYGVIREKGESSLIKGKVGGTGSSLIAEKVGKKDIYYHTHPEPRFLEEQVMWRYKQGSFDLKKETTSKYPSTTDIREGTPELIFSKEGITFYEATLGTYGAKGKVSISEIKAQGGKAAFLPYENVKNIGQKYQMSLGRYKVNKASGLSAGKTQLYIETPKNNIFQGVVRFVDSKTKKAGKISQVIDVEKTSGIMDKKGNTQYIENPEATQSSLLKSTQQAGGQVSANIQIMGERYAKGEGSAYKFASTTVQKSEQKAKGIMSDSTLESAYSQTAGKQIQFNFLGSSTIGRTIESPLTTFKEKTKGSEFALTTSAYVSEQKTSAYSNNIIIESEITKQKDKTAGKESFAPLTTYRQVTEQRTAYKTFSAYGGGTGILPPPPIEIITPPPNDKYVQESSYTSSEGQAYNSYAKQGGSYVKLNKKPLSLNQARSLAGQAVDNSSSRTLKVQRTSGNPVYDAQAGFSFNEYKFKAKKKTPEQEVYTEKSGYAIDTQGEVQGISAKGWIAQRRKKTFKTMF